MTEMLLRHIKTGGKRLRAKLCMEVHGALGGDGVSALPVGAACELFHNATLIHDDIQDGDKVRRAQPTLWTQFGMNQAINAGDMMLLLPVNALQKMRASDRMKWKVSEALMLSAQKVVMGQALEPQLLQDLEQDIGFEKLMFNYLQCIEGKTSELFSFSAVASGLLLEKSEEELEGLKKIFQSIGTAFQIQDDILDLYGDKGRESAGQDLKEGKVSVLVVQHCQKSPTEKKRLVQLLRTSREQTSEQEVQWAIESFRRSGALKQSLELMNHYLLLERESQLLEKYPMLKMLTNDFAKKITEPISFLLH